MPHFNYTALDARDTMQTGVLEEIDRAAAAQRLIRQGLRPLEISRAKEAGSGRFALARLQRDRITRADIDFFTKQLALLLSAGLSLDGALRIMTQNAHKQAFRDFTHGLERNLKEGRSFSQALAAYPKHFSSMYVNIAKAGEEGGILPAMLGKISEYQGTFRELKQFIVSASIYPAILMLVGAIALIVLLTAILPRFEVLFEGLDRQLPVHVQALMAVANLAGNYPAVTIALIVGPPLALLFFLKTPRGHMWFDRVSLRLPLLSGFVRTLETTRIFRTIEVLVKNGVHLATALKISSGVANNLAYKRLLVRATQALKEGQRVGRKLKGEELFPALAIDLLSIGEESGRVGQVCGQIADHYEEELRTRIKRIIALIEPAFILGIAIMAGYVVISMLSVILSINEIAT